METKAGEGGWGKHPVSWKYHWYFKHVSVPACHTGCWKDDTVGPLRMKVPDGEDTCKICLRMLEKM